MVVHAQVLSVQSVETAPSLLLSTEARRFLFNVGDGTQRLCMEHHVRLAKLQHVFLTELRSHAVGGLPGMVLTVSDTGKPGLHVHGPVGTRQYLQATRHFLHRPEFKLEAFEASYEVEDKHKSCYEDEEVVVYSVAVAKPRVGAKRKLNESPRLSTEADTEDTAAAHTSASYVVETRPQRGKFLVQRAMELGVPKGKLFGELHHGKDVTLPDGRVVKSSDCVLPSVPAAGCAIVSCPSVAHVDALVTSKGFCRYQEMKNKAAEVKLEVVFHLCGVEKTVYRASAMLQAQMHVVFPKAFPSNESHELRDPAKPFSRTVPDASSLELSASCATLREGSESSEMAASKLVLGESMLNVKSAVETVATQAENVKEKHLDKDLIDGRITFLGTGCAIPSKYRNVTGMYLELPIGNGEDDGSWAGMMLDCGEGSLGQLYRADSEPLLVIGPTPLRFWLEEYSKLDPTVGGKYTFVENYCFDEKDERFTEVETHAKASRVHVWLNEALGISQIECVPVKHCMQSYALVVTFAVDGSKLAFSGDCRPSDDLAAKAHGAFLIVHEATFEDDLASEAKQKAHSTTAEAIEVGSKANARHLLLTHFSQRYPKMSALANPSDQSTDKDEAPMQVLTTIDMLSLRFRELRQLLLMEVCAQLMAQDEEEDNEDPEAAASIKAQREREQRKNEKSLTR
ncbi:Zinc phosphodiesterase ELAC protein 2 [Phytophthora boehmeriae]|uniref:Zinc phosphodiesterase ELAC protein 2 n=1 Tax=Phytophthora boehmeriae TaxID=109152 RepID=A0A8T1WUJ0_9STRA|nr:Zinc phosphodiesterase ELAC protein 2 [Phytophthora boehmeriae]